MQGLQSTSGVQMGGPARRTAEATARTGSPVRDLAERLASSDHPRVRAELARLAGVLTVVVRDESDRHPEVVVPLRSAFAGLRADVLAHLERTDAQLVPALVACGLPADDARASDMAAARAALDRATRSVAAGHPVIRTSLERLRMVTRGYAPPDDAGPEFRALYYGLAALERDLDAGLRSERELILPGAAALARPADALSGDRLPRLPRSS